VHLIALKSKDAKVKNTAEKLYQDLLAKNIEVLFDDREDISAGEKFADADLIGCPYRAVISDKTINQGAVEMKKRNSVESKLVKLDNIFKELK
jgi:prolyl-tRNA synthetase